MKQQTDGRMVDIQGVGQTAAASIQLNAMAVNILSSGVYTDRPLAVVRELSANAYDAHAMAGNLGTPFDVIMPTEIEPVFAVRDYGTGLSHDKIMTLYMTYFGSDKRDSNDWIGGLGLGSKSPLAYTDMFTVEARDGGSLREYMVYKDSAGLPQISHIRTEANDEPQGLTVKVPVANTSDHYLFRRAAQRVLLWFPEHSYALVNLSSYDKPDPLTYRLNRLNTSTPYALAECNELLAHGAYATMGNMAYVLDTNLILRPHDTAEEAERSAADHKLDRAIARYFQSQTDLALILPFDIGDLAIQASREALSYNDATLDVLRQRMREAFHRLAIDLRGQTANRPSTTYEHWRFRQRLRHTMFNKRGGDRVLDALSSYMRNKEDELKVRYCRYQQLARLTDKSAIEKHTRAGFPLYDTTSPTLWVSAPPALRRRWSLFQGLREELTNIPSAENLQVIILEVPREQIPRSLTSEPIWPLDELVDPAPRAKPRRVSAVAREPVKLRVGLFTTLLYGNPETAVPHDLIQQHEDPDNPKRYAWAPITGRTNAYACAEDKDFAERVAKNEMLLHALGVLPEYTVIAVPRTLRRLDKVFATSSIPRVRELTITVDTNLRDPSIRKAIRRLLLRKQVNADAIEHLANFFFLDESGDGVTKARLVPLVRRLQVLHARPVEYGATISDVLQAWFKDRTETYQSYVAGLNLDQHISLKRAQVLEQDYKLLMSMFSSWAYQSGIRSQAALALDLYDALAEKHDPIASFFTEAASASLTH